MVRSPKGSSSFSRICSAVSTLVLAAASSMASGMPSSLLQRHATAGAFCPSARSPNRSPGALDEEPHRLVARQLLGRERAPGIGHGETRHHEVGLAAVRKGSRLVARMLRMARAQQGVGELGARLHQVLAVVQDDDVFRLPVTRALRSARGPAPLTPRPTACATAWVRARGRRRGRAPPTTPRARTARPRPGPPPGRAASCPRPPDRTASAGAARRAASSPPRAPLAPDEARALERQIVGRTPGGRTRGKTTRDPVLSLEVPSARRREASGSSRQAPGPWRTAGRVGPRRKSLLSGVVDLTRTPPFLQSRTIPTNSNCTYRSLGTVSVARDAIVRREEHHRTRDGRLPTVASDTSVVWCPEQGQSSAKAARGLGTESGRRA